MYVPYLLYCSSAVILTFGYFGIVKKICYWPSGFSTSRYTGKSAIARGVTEVIFGFALMAYTFLDYSNFHNLFHIFLLILISIFFSLQLFEKHEKFYRSINK